MVDAPQITRVRHELKRRRLEVARVERMPPNMVRIVLRSEELRGFTSPGFDDHIKQFFPVVGDTAAPAMRDFTPRHFDARSGELWVDFYLHEAGPHEAGPAASWAAQAAVGQTLEIAGPKGSAVIALEGVDFHVFIGDETALPAIGRRLGELPAGSRALVVVESDPHAERPMLESQATLEIVWVPRLGSGGSPALGIIDALRGVALPPGNCFIWVAVESQAARAIRGYLRTERGLDKRWIKAAGYWQQGNPGSHDSIRDEE